ncbi:MAG: 4Fe-4S binding protein [Pseudomonadota bacterium]
MAMKITEDCSACGACVPECPTNSIVEGDVYTINPTTCNECKDQPDGSKCVAICPVECIKKT